jgi:2-polyprenyl-3-methyl-5-hydroxy-6-metoxy-1,4-benzoquinol methylase
MSLNYRNIIYNNYHTTQSGRSQNVKKLISAQSAFFQKEIIPLLPPERSSAILDIGAGNGSFLLACKSNGYRNIQGVDLSQEQIVQAQNHGIDCIELANAIDWLNSNTKQFDVITAIDLVEHLTKDEITVLLPLIRKNLSPQGLFIFRTPNLDCPLPNPYARGDFSHETFLNKHSATQLLLAIGFSDIQIKPGLVFMVNPFKEFLRKLVMGILVVKFKLKLFAFGYASKDILISPNLIAVGSKS